MDRFVFVIEGNEKGGAVNSQAITLFDHMAMTIYPVVARAFGYTFRVGTESNLKQDGRSVLRAVWSEKVPLPPPEVASYGDRYDRATTWIVAYHHHRPVGVMGLLDMRIASMSLDYEGRLAPTSLDLTTTREIGRLAILREHRGGAQLVMVGLLREMLAWAKSSGIVRLFSGSTAKLYRVYRRFNATARLLKPLPPIDPEQNPTKDRFFANLRAYGGDTLLFTFDVAGASPWSVFSRFLRSLVHARRRP